MKYNSWNKLLIWIKIRLIIVYFQEEKNKTYTSDFSKSCQKSSEEWRGCEKEKRQSKKQRIILRGNFRIRLANEGLRWRGHESARSRYSFSWNSVFLAAPAWVVPEITTGPQFSLSTFCFSFMSYFQSTISFFLTICLKKKIYECLRDWSNFKYMNQ